MTGNIVCYRFLRSLNIPWLGGGIFEGFWGILRVLARLHSNTALVLGGLRARLRSIIISPYSTLSYVLLLITQNSYNYKSSTSL